MSQSLKRGARKIIEVLERIDKNFRRRCLSLGSPLGSVLDYSKVEISSSDIQFIDMLRKIESPRVLELGTRRSVPSRSTNHKSWVPHYKEYVGVDLFEGEDVDIVVDCHELTTKIKRNYFDAFISCSTFEHIKYPWIVALELNKVLKIHGVGFIQTHQTFPIHAYPHDYWRYTTEAFESLFNKHSGFRILKGDYSFPCVVKPLSEIESWEESAPSYLNVNVLVQKIGDFLEDSFRWKRLATTDAE